MGEETKYWKSLAERDGDAEFRRQVQDEFAEELPTAAKQLGRRDFLKLGGLSAALATAAGCSRAPVEKAIPYLVQPEEVVPGRAIYYASTCGGCSAGCGVLAKNRDGRPIKLEGNPEHPVSRGGLCAAGQASLLGLYDSARYKAPFHAGNDVSWEETDRTIQAALAKARESKGAVRFLTSTINSPTQKALVGEFLASFADGKHVQYDALSVSAILDAHQRTHGLRALPRYRFDKAEVIVSFDADFLGTWISPVEFTRAYQDGRTLAGDRPRMSWHAQIESRMSLTGSNADRRVVVAPHELGAMVAAVAARVGEHAGIAIPFSRDVASYVSTKETEAIADRLWQARGKSLVVSGSNDVAVQALVNFINHALWNYGQTLDLERPSYQQQGSDGDMAALLAELKAGKVAALFIYRANPVFELPEGAELAKTLKNVPLVVSFAERPDETAAAAHWICPDHNALESWADTESIAGVISVTQPTIRPLGQTRPMIESLAAWSGKPAKALDLLRESWRKSVFARQSREKAFDRFWDRAVHDGFVQVEAKPLKLASFNTAALLPPVAQAPNAGEYALVMHPTIGMADGRHAYNPWLHELPDPVTKITWDNYASLSPAAAKALGVQQGQTVLIEAAGKSLVLPAYIQPGQHDRTVAVALGFGSQMSARFAKVGPQWLESKLSVGENGLVGMNAAPLLELRDGALHYTRAVKLTRGAHLHELASTQDHHNLTPPNPLAFGAAEPRPIVQATTLAALAKDPKAGAPHAHEVEGELYPADHPYTGHRWAMAIDLTACTGCSGCVVACQVENNIPVVGKDEVRRKREMHWLRIDRYYAETAAGLEAVHQPMMCQQCEHASCENVCPVLATVHSEEGLNQQVYNRCVGTRYCANNCAYKTRRFNWFDYAHDDRLQNLVLNPDVTVRTRGIMEKCTFCVQRIQEAKLAARARGEKVKDGEIQTACQQSCPAGAIVFGDMNDPESKVSKLMASGRAYRVLEELNVRPSVTYLRAVRNREEKEEHHG